jgi:hypothetical protein
MTGIPLLLLLTAGPQGVAPGWDLKPNAEKIGADVERLRPLIGRLDPVKWTEAGAPKAYEKQWRDCLDGIGHVQNAAHRLAERPDRLSLAAETLVRLEALIEHALSLSQAVRRYQNPAIAEVLESEISAAGASRQWLRQHVMELSATREQELETAEKEAQRCRTEIVRPGARKQ